jgi:hypothetical protein
VIFNKVQFNSELSLTEIFEWRLIEILVFSTKNRKITAEIKINYRLTTSFSIGSIAGLPSCCQHRRLPFTRREQGVPFFVSAPQKYIVSCAPLV